MSVRAHTLVVAILFEGAGLSVNRVKYIRNHTMLLFVLTRSETSLMKSALRIRVGLKEWGRESEQERVCNLLCREAGGRHTAWLHVH